MKQNGEVSKGLPLSWSVRQSVHPHIHDKLSAHEKLFVVTEVKMKIKKKDYEIEKIK